MSVSRIMRFVARYVLRNPRYVVSYALAYIRPGFVSNARFYTEQEVVSLLREGRSLIRLGDGEINLLLGLKNVYHRPDPRLQSMIRSIVTGYSSGSPYLLSVPRFVNVPNIELRAMGKLNVWLPLKVMFRSFFPKDLSYMDAHSFYYDGYFEEVVAPLFEGKTIILVTNESTIQRQSKNPTLPWKEPVFISVPAENVLDALDEIQGKIDEALRSFPAKDAVLLFAAGPVGKYLIAEYAERGYQGIDIGKVAEVMFTDETISYLV